MKVLTAVAILAVVPFAVAQDVVRLNSKKTIRGEVTKETTAEVTLIDLMGVIRTVKMADVARVRRGRAMKVVVTRRLKGVGVADTEAMMTVATWAKERKNSRDAKIIARRVLSLDQKHQGARDLLGHVMVEEVWHPNQKAADAALASAMEKRGMVKEGEAWVKIELRGEVQAAPDLWMVEGLFWRKIADVMRERGFVDWNGEWYKKEALEKFKPGLEELQEAFGSNFHAAQVESCRVYTIFGREETEGVARELAEARRWFCELYGMSKFWLESPVSSAFVLSSQNDLEAFGARWKKRYSLADDRIERIKLIRSLTLPSLSKGIHKGYTTWRYNLVSSMGAELMLRTWKPGFKIPAWIFIAAAHTAEFKVLGTAKTQWVQKREYARAGGEKEPKGRNFAAIKSRVKTMLKGGSINMRELFGKQSANDMTPELEMYGIVLMEWFHTEKKEKWFEFIKTQQGGYLLAHFKKVFGMEYESLEKEFIAWLSKQA